MTTSNPQDKYAFLFTGPTANHNYVRDIEKVYQTLTKYYNYIPNHIRVVCGTTDAEPSVPGVTVETVSSEAELNTKLQEFAENITNPGPGKTVLLYFTGCGCREQSGNELVSKLFIDGSGCANAVGPDWLGNRLGNFDNMNHYVHVVMQQSYSGGFEQELIDSGLSHWSFTSACGADEDSFGNSDGGYFTDGWTRGLRLEPIPDWMADAGTYADQLGSADESTNLLVSLEEAMEFGKRIQEDYLGYTPDLSTPVYNGGTHYLGLPEFLIRDGDYEWWESPDIYLTHPNDEGVPPGDLYIPDDEEAESPFNNTINVEVRNVGTHPVRAYSLGVELFKTGACGDSDQHTASNKVPSGGILFPIDLADIGEPDTQDTYEWNTPFYETCTHRCVKAEAKLLYDDVDFAWSVVANDFEGQRNIDVMIIQPLPARSPVANLQGFKEHVYTIRNPFDVPRTFYLVFPDKYPEYKKYISLKCADITGHKRKRPLKVVKKPVPHIPFRLKPGQGKEISLRAEMNPKSKFPRKGMRLPFDILVEGKWDKARTSKYAALLPGCAPISGITVEITEGGVTLEGKVSDSRKKPIPGARISLRTLNGLQKAHIRTDKKGRYTFRDINQDIYKIQAGIGSRRSKEKTIVLLNEKKEFDINLKWRVWERARRTKEH